MKQSKSPAIKAKVAAMYGKRLNMEDYKTLLQKNSLADIASFLKSHPSYAQVLKQIDPTLVHRDFLEAVLQRESFFDFLKLFHYLGKEERDFLQTVIISYEIEEILWCLGRLIDTNVEFAGFADFRYDYIDPYSTLDFVQLAACRSDDELIEALTGTPYSAILAALPRKDNQIVYSAAEHSLWAYYYRTFFDRIKKKFGANKAKDIQKIVGIEVDTINLAIIARLRLTFNLPADEVRSYLLEQTHKLTPSVIEELLQTATAKEFAEVLRKTAYRSIPGNADMRPGQRLDLLLMQNARRIIHFSDSPIALILAYLTFKKTELKNLKTVVEACRYNVPREKTINLLINL